MGAIISGVRNLNVVFVDDDPAEVAESVGFSPNIFTDREWTTLKEFANKRHIRQKELNLVFQRFLTHEEVYLRKFHVRLNDVKAYFLKRSRLMQELSDVLIPMIYLKEYRGLDLPDTKPGAPPVDDVSFARFVIMSFIFCAQPIPDLIFDFVAILRRKLNLKLNAVMFYFNFEQIVKVLIEEITPCTTLDVFMRHCNPQDDAEIDVQKLMLLCLKYPLAFYSLIRYRNHFRRLVFGDIFWANKKPLKSRFYAKFHLDGDYSKAFNSEAAARRDTARAIIQDCENQQTAGKLILTDHIPADPLYSISEECFLKTKQILGYRFARGLIMEAELPLDKSFPLFTKTAIGRYTDEHKEEDVHHERILDSVTGCEFTYSVETGTREWIRKIEDADGGILREVTTQYPNGILVNQLLERNDAPVTKLSPKKIKPIATFADMTGD
jgi:hypothetical protein